MTTDNNNSSVPPITMITGDNLDVLAAAMDADEWLPAVDTETEYREALKTDNIPGAVRVISVCTLDSEGTEQVFVVDCRDTPADAIAELMTGRTLCGWNANFDDLAMTLSGFPPEAWWCAMISDAVLRCGRSGIEFYRSLDAASVHYTGEGLVGKKTTSISYDATSDLTEEQIRYSAHDALATRRVASAVRAEILESDLSDTCDLEQGARKFIGRIMTSGMPFDLEGYLDEAITERQKAVDDHTAELASQTTEVGQYDLFQDEPVVSPSWNPASRRDTMEAFNRWARDAVLDFTEKVHGERRLLTESDSLRADDIKQIDSPLVRTYLARAKAIKDVSTYGKQLRPYHRGGRFFSRYKQAVVSTGRLASWAFNAQNTSPGMHKYMKPRPGFVLVYGDLSQAELRFTAHVSGEERMIEAFARGDDMHHATMLVMNPDLDPSKLSTKELKDLRTTAKVVNFGIVYGMGPRALAKNLTNAGVPTSPAEAKAYIDAFFTGYPKVHEWLEARGKEVDRIAAGLEVSDFDFYGSLTAYNVGRKVLRSSWGQGPLPAEEAGVTERDAFGSYKDMTIDELADWAVSTMPSSEAVLLSADGTPFEFHSRNGNNRRRCFNVAMDAKDLFADFLPTLTLIMTDTDKEGALKFVRSFFARNGLYLPTEADRKADRSKARLDILEQFKGNDGRRVRSWLIEAAVSRFGDITDRTFLRAAQESVRASRNAYKNHPIQSGVADVMEHAFGVLQDSLPEGPEPVLTVHDSTVIECPEELADEVAGMLKEALDDAMSLYCSTVAPKTDVDIRSSLAEDDVIRAL